MMQADVAEETQKLSPDRLVTLFEIDATNIGGTLFRFCSSIDTNFDITSITFYGATATVTTATPHLLLSGNSVRIAGCDQYNYNGDFTVASVSSSTQFVYYMLSVPSSNATGSYKQGIRLNNAVKFGGNFYIPVEVEATGFEWNGGASASLPTPTFKISNKHKLIAAAVISLKDLRGAKFTRIRTFGKYLDSGSAPSVNKILPKDIYRINRKTSHNKYFIEFELASSLDQEGVKIPQMRCLRDACLQRYRSFNGNSFDYSSATCPYTGGNYFDQAGKPVYTAAEDKCGKHLSDCILRFGGNQLPFLGTPGIGKK
jgi:lambda family phage minor tail protein L